MFYAASGVSQTPKTFYIMKGEAEYNDNGVTVQLVPGDMTFTPDGSGHAVANNGAEDVEIIALILY